MKLLIAMIRPDRLPEVLEALFKADVRGLSISRIQGHGGEMERMESYRGTLAKMTLSEKMRLEIGVTDQQLQPTLDVLLGAARTGKVGDGKIFVLPVEAVYQIRSGEAIDEQRLMDSAG